MFQRLNSREIERILAAAWSGGLAKSFRGSAPYLVRVAIERDGEGAVVIISTEPRQPGANERIPVSSRVGLAGVADRVELLLYPDESGAHPA